jgi:hypothetical protein
MTRSICEQLAHYRETRVGLSWGRLSPREMVSHMRTGRINLETTPIITGVISHGRGADSDQWCAHNMVRS